MNLSELISAVIAEKKGDKEFRLGFLDGWTAEIGGHPGCLLGESSGEFKADGPTPEAAVAALLDKVRSST